MRVLGPLMRWHKPTFRCLSRTRSFATAARDTRLAGRQRFYRTVDVKEVSAPWLDATVLETTVASPISAGVDGTDSATGVSRGLNGASTTSLEQQLRPRRPGTSWTTPTVDIGAWFGVTLDDRILRTPLGQVLSLPSRSLAYSIAAEWNRQAATLLPTQMPLMTAACTALDQASRNPEHYRNYCLQFLSTDTICYYAEPTQDRVLYQRQQRAWQDVHKFIEECFGYVPATALGHHEGVLMAKNAAGLPHAPKLVDEIHDFVNELDAWHLVALHAAVSECKSLLLAISLLLDHTSPQQCIDAARTEEEFQISNWGLVEGQHDYDRLNCAVQLNAASLLKDCLALEHGWM